jgi:tRNA U55 pseudouridine synthase TruB
MLENHIDLRSNLVLVMDTADHAGQILETTDHIPTEIEAKNVCGNFLGKIWQIPPAYSALKKMVLGHMRWRG